jgi:sugar lactone lactonase YvrE
MKQHSTYLLRPFCLLLLTFYFSQSVLAQEVSEQEVLKSIEVRERLLEQGILEQTELIPQELEAGDARLLDFASYMGINGNVTTQESRATDFSPDGKTMYVIGRVSQDVRQFRLTRAWDVSSASETGRYDLFDDLISRTQDLFAANGIYIDKDNGSRMWIFNRVEIWEYSLGTPWDISTASPSGYKDLSDNVVRGHDFDFKPDGTRIFIDDRIIGAVFQYDLEIPWDIESIGNPDHVLDISSRQVAVRGTQLSPEGDRMFLMDTGAERIYEYNLSRPYDLSSASYYGSYSVSAQADEPTGLTFKPDFTRFYVTSEFEDKIYQYKLSIIDPDRSSISSDRDRIIADGLDTGTIEVKARDDEGDAISGVDITLNPGNRLRVTNNNGVASFSISNDEAEIITYRASGLGIDIDDEVTVNFVTIDAQESSVITDVGKVVADGEAAARITVTARDEDGETVEGVPIELKSDRNNVSINAINQETDGNGKATFEVSSSSQQTVTLSASGLGIDIEQTATVRFVSVDPDESSITANFEKVLANGSASGRITVTARDEDGDELRDVNIELLASSNNVEIDAVNATTDSDGEAVFQISSEVAETVSFTAEGLGTRINGEVVIRFVTVDPEQSEIIVSDNQVVADGQETSRIRVITRDEDGDELEGARVSLVSLNGTAVIDNDSKVTDEDGIADFFVSNQNPQNVDFEVQAEGIDIPPVIRIGFKPVAPVALAASSVKTREFVANWELVNGAESYIIDVSDREDFTSTLPSYNAKNVGNQTSAIIENVSPGTTYFYRLRAKTEDLISGNSQTIETTTFPEIPVIAGATDRNALKFTVNWQEAEGAVNYRLDVARDSNFEDMVSGFDDINTGAGTSYVVTGLFPGEQYFYRVRSEAGPRLSGYSEIAEARTLTISSEQSEFDSEQLRVLANGDQKNRLQITVKSDEGILLEGLTIQLTQTEGNSEIEAVQPVTNDEGVAVFAVSSQTAGKATYTASVVGIEFGEISVEFLQDEGVLKLGDNYPNPFQRETVIPVTVPRTMQVTVTVYNSLGAPVRTVIDEQLESGYYEIPFLANDLASGVYFYRLMTGEDVRTEKMVLVK